jgi:hypothetical protein
VVSKQEQPGALDGGIHCEREEKNMGTYRSRKQSQSYFDPTSKGPHAWPEEAAVVDLLDQIGVDGNDDETRDAIVKLVGDLRAKLHRAFNAFENITVTQTLEDAHNQAHREVSVLTQADAAASGAVLRRSLTLHREGQITESLLNETDNH